jgi:hypothetical protein
MLTASTGNPRTITTRIGTCLNWDYLYDNDFGPIAKRLLRNFAGFSPKPKDPQMATSRLGARGRFPRPTQLLPPRGKTRPTRNRGRLHPLRLGREHRNGSLSASWSTAANPPLIRTYVRYCHASPTNLTTSSPAASTQ